MLLDAGADVNDGADGDEACVPLDMWAGSQYAEEGMELMIKYGASVDARSPDDGRTALFTAVLKGREGPVRILLDAGADVNVSDSAGYRPLIWAAEHGHLDVLRLMVAHGGDLNSTDGHGLTAYDRAVQGGKSDVAAWIKLQLETGTG